MVHSYCTCIYIYAATLGVPSPSFCTYRLGQALLLNNHICSCGIVTMLGLAFWNTASHCFRAAGSLSAGAMRMASNHTICLSGFSASSSYLPSADWMPSKPFASPSKT